MIQELMARAEQRGYVTYDDILELLEDEGEDLSLDTILYELDELGIEYRQDSELIGMAVLDDTETDYDLDETAPDPMLGDINAVSADDPVGLYFRQMAQEPSSAPPMKSTSPNESNTGRSPRKSSLDAATRSTLNASCVMRRSYSRDRPPANIWAAPTPASSLASPSVICRRASLPRPDSRRQRRADARGRQV